jgi:Flavin-binding monooxygenase-like
VEWTQSVTSKSPDAGKTFEEEFDHIVVANGSDSRPFIPYIDGLWDWKGEVLHSRWYRDAKVFAGKVNYISASSQGHKLISALDGNGRGCWALE